MTTATTTVLPTLLSLCERRFSLQPGQLAAGDDLFETLRVDSLQALVLLTELERAFSCEIPDWELAEVRTFASLAAVIERRT